MNPYIKIPPDALKTIEQYILKEMTVEEQEAFTLQMQQSKELREQVYSVNLLITGIREHTLEEKMGSFHQDLVEQNKSKHQSTAKLAGMQQWLLAASVLFAVAIGAWLFFGSSTTGEKLFTEVYKPDPGLISAMSTSDNYLFDRAMIDYKTANYKAAIKSWETMIESNPANDTLHYFLGSAYLADDMPAKATEHFKQVTTVPDSYFLNDAYWYLGLALLKEGRTKEAASFIQKSDNEAKEQVLQQLNSPKQ